MLRWPLAFTLPLLLTGLPACAHEAPAVVPRPIAHVQVIDRASGAVLPVYVHQGRRYVVGAPGARYAIAIANRSGGRVLAVVSVDGVNAVTGETAAWDQNGYVFAPGQRWEVRGWRKSSERVAAFEFTSLADAYASRTGRPDHVGVIGVALFGERVPPPAPPPAVLQSESTAREGTARDSGSGAASEAAPAAAPAPSAERRSEAGRLGTGHGASEISRVGSTRFERARSTPDEVVSIYYDSRERLVALGVIPPLRPTPWPDPFPAEAGWVPDPPAR
jgi:hypothetical protein